MKEKRIFLRENDILYIELPAETLVLKVDETGAQKELITHLGYKITNEMQP